MSPPLSSGQKAVQKQARAEARAEHVALREALIQAVRERPPIWDKTDRQHKHKGVIQGLWGEVGSLLGRPDTECKRIWKNLVDVFRVKVCDSQARCVVGMDDARPVTWRYYNSMMFLRGGSEKNCGFSNSSASESRIEIVSCNTQLITQESLLDVDEGRACFKVENDIESVPELQFEYPITLTLPTSSIDHSPNPLSGAASPSCSTSDNSTPPVTLTPYKRRKEASSEGQGNATDNFQVADVISRPLVAEKRSNFVNFLDELLQEVPKKHLRTCRMEILAVTNRYIDME